MGTAPRGKRPPCLVLGGDWWKNTAQGCFPPFWGWVVVQRTLPGMSWVAPHGVPRDAGGTPSWQHIAAGCRQSHAMVGIGGLKSPLPLVRPHEEPLRYPHHLHSLEGDTEGTLPTPRPIPWGQGTAPGSKPTSFTLWELPHTGPSPVCPRIWLFPKHPAHITDIWTAGPLCSLESSWDASGRAKRVVLWS